MLARAYSVKIGVIFGVRFERRKETFKYFCQISLKSITIIQSYAVSKLVRFWDTVYSCKEKKSNLAHF